MEAILNYTLTHVWQILLIIYAIAFLVVDVSRHRLKRKYALQGCALIDAQLNYKKYLKGNNELLKENVDLKLENINLTTNIGKIDLEVKRLRGRLQDANIQLINAKGELLRQKMKKKEISHEGIFIADPANAATIYHDFRGWRVKRHGSMGYIAGWNTVSGEIILGFYEYTGNNNIAITDDCIMSRREFVDYNSVTINELRELGFV